MYRKIENKDIQRLGDIVGKDFVLTDKVAKQTYSHDETPDLRAEPEVIVKPADSKQISEIMQLATAEKLPITPRGGGTGLSGGAVPVMGGIVLTTERMNKLLDLDKFNSMAVVEAGLINANLQTEAEKSGLFYPVNPASMDTCTLGGNVAEAAGGANAVRYGTTRNYVTGLEVVLPDGAETRAGGKILKNATDNDLVHLILGSEGTLAVITRIIMRLVPKPKHTVMLIIPFDEVEPISETVQAIFARRITPTMVELMDRKTLKACEKFLGETIQYSDAGCQLIIRLDSDSADENTKLYEIIGEICLEHGAEDVLVAEDNTSLERIWKMRRSIHESLVKEAGLLADEDVVVPRSKITELLRGVENISQKLELPSCTFGHLGDGNIHVNFLKEDLEEQKARAALKPALEELFKLAASLGGKVSGEHGVGCFKKPYMHLTTDKRYLQLRQQIKNTFDPANILNPGKII